MDRIAEFRNRQRATTKALTLAILMIIMDMSGLSGVYAGDQEELDERQNKRETISSLNMPGFQKGLANSSTTFDVANEHSCAILSDGGIYCWGEGHDYNLGRGNYTDSQLPTPATLPSGLTAVHISLGVSGGHNCALLSNSSVWCWGNDYAAGDPSASYNPVPAMVPLDSTAVLVESSNAHSCAILSNGSVQCWGNNYNGQLGVGYTCEYDVGDCATYANDAFLENPVYPVLPAGSIATGLNLWNQNTCVLMTNASYYCFGADWNSPWPVLKKTEIAAAVGNYLLHSNQELEFWSYYGNWDGWYENLCTRTQSNDSCNTEYLPDETKFRSIVGTYCYYPWCGTAPMAVLDNGTVIIGESSEYQNMGINGAYNGPGYLSNTFYQHPSNRTVAAVATGPGAGNSANCVIYDDGSAQCWGPSVETGSSFTCTSGAYDQFGNPTGCTDGNYVGSPVWVEFPAGLHVALGEFDDDGDGVSDMVDSCSNGVTGWTSNASTDYDSDGCRDSDEDDDDDGDGYADSVDNHPTNEMFHHNLTMDQGWILGGRYENVSASYGTYLGDMISESQSSSFRAQGADGYRITVDGQLAYDGSIISVNWDTTDKVIAITPTRYNGAACVILESGALRCWGNNYDGQVGSGDSESSSNYYPSVSANVSFPVLFTPKHITTGYYSSCAVLENGEAYCWGRNEGHHSLGVGYRCDSNSWANGCDGAYNIREPSNPVIIPPGSSAESIYVSQYYNGLTCLVLTDGNAYCMGSNSYGQLGNGNTNSVEAHEAPEQVYLPPGISAEIQTMALASYTTCALWDNGSVYCWGQNNKGQLGDGTVCAGGNYENNCNGNTAKPIIYDPVIFPSGESAIALWLENRDDSNAGFCSLLTSGGIWCWGALVTNETGAHTGTGEYQNIFQIGDFIQPGNRDWDSDGIYNTNDNCAAGIQGWSSTSSNDVDGDGCIDATEDDDDDGDGYSDTTEIACGTDPLNGTDVPLDPDNDGICNAFDDDDDNDGVLDVDDEFPNDPYGFVHLSLGDGFQSGQPEDNATLGASYATTCAILSDDSMSCWGKNDVGQIGDGTRGTQRYTATTVSLPAGKTPVSVSVSGTYGKHFCSVMDDGSLYCWGNNDNGQLGLGHKCTSGSYIDGCNGNYGHSSPSHVSLPAGRTATAVSAGYWHTCAILDDGSVWCWGRNTDGELGVGNSSNSGDWRFSPNAVMMPSGTSAIAIAIGDQHSCMVVDDGRAFCWGDGNSGEIGDGSSSDRNIPTQVSGTASYVSISSGPQFNCAITNIGTVQCWGLNNYQQLGMGFNAGNQYSPQNTALPAGIEASSLALGSEHACAVMETMSVYCWGMDDYGQLNTAYECNGDFTNGCGGDGRHTPAPAQLPTDRGGIAVTAGYRFTCVFINNGGINCFGQNSDGQLGNGTTEGSGPNYVGLPIGISPQTNDRDLDHDGVFNNEDLCMEGETGWTSNNTTDNDGDGCQDSSEDLDDDNDFLNDTDEATIGTNATNPDTDGDGYLDGLDDFPLDGSEWLDTDGDGIGNNADTDDDNDGWSDSAEYYCLTDPLNGTDVPSDFDGDGNCDYTDNDDDNDGTLDNQDDFPYDAGADTDTDGDGMPDTLVANYTGNLTEDFDDDNDGWNDTAELDCGYNPLSNMSTPTDLDGDSVCDTLDAFPNDPSEWDDTDGDGVGDNSDDFPNDANETTDTDGDGIGDNSDPDADNDGWSNTDEGLCLTDWLDNTSVPGDIDNDGICDAQEQDLDNDGWTNSNESVCGTDWDDVNSVPTDTDGDWICDIMDNDDDGDGYFDDVDAFPLDNSEWLDTDGDGVGNNADPDDDNDGCMDISDDLPLDPTECTDTDGDGIGNNADADDDGDGLPDDEDPFPNDGAATIDTDGDGMPDYLNGNSTTGLVPDPDDDNDGYNDTDDAFPLDNSEWLDTDGDGVGNNADINDDGDNCPDVNDAFPLDSSECLDTDGDGIGNNADTDDDNDGWFDGTEMACGTSDPLNASSVPDDNDEDGVCDMMDVDDDNDSFVDSNDAFPFDPCAAEDFDGDGMPDWIVFNCNTTLIEDLDDDNDGYDDTNDTFPQDASEWSDFDGDGFGDNMDTDDDGDTVPDVYDEFPLNATEWNDADDDGIGDNADEDDDNDGVLDTDDDFPNDAAASTDTDGDGMPDTLVGNVSTSLTEDLDDDGDGVLDIYDAFPLDSSEWTDTDGDGIGDNADSDDDGDSWSDSDEYICGTDPLDSSDVPADSDGDGICDSEDDDGPTTLGAKLIQFAFQPVTLWMLIIGVIVSLFLGLTATSMSLRSSREMKRSILEDQSSVLDRGMGWDKSNSGVEIPVQQSAPTPTPIAVEDDQDKLQKLIDQGYSSEVAQVILENEEN